MEQTQFIFDFKVVSKSETLDYLAGLTDEVQRQELLRLTLGTYDREELDELLKPYLKDLKLELTQEIKDIMLVCPYAAAAYLTAYHREFGNIEGLEELTKMIPYDPFGSFVWAFDCIKGRYPEGEEAIATMPTLAFNYAKKIIKGRFPEGELAILRSEFRGEYATLIGED